TGFREESSMRPALAQSSRRSSTGRPRRRRPFGYGPAPASVNEGRVRLFRAGLVQGLILVVLLMGGTIANAAPLKILAFGDSLTAGYGLMAADGFPAQLEAALRA